MKKRIWKIKVFIIFFLNCMFCLKCMAYTDIMVGQWNVSANENDNVIATLYNDGILEITGTGEMKSFEESESLPWKNYAENINQVEIKSGITNISKNMLKGCINLSSIEIPEGITTIENYAFYGANNLTNINIPASVNSIGTWAFEECSNLLNINVNEDNKYFYSLDGVLYDKNKTEIIKCPAGISTITILNDITKIGNYAFSGCIWLTSITIPDSVTSIGNGAFYGCNNLENIVIPDTVNEIGNSAFWGCSNLKNISIPNDVTSIKDYAFWGCSSLEDVKLSGNLNILGKYAFYKCSNLKTIIIPTSVTNIGDSAFLDCRDLTIYCEIGSTAEQYAKANEINYENIEITIKSDAKYIDAFLEIDDEKYIIVEKKTTVENLLNDVETNYNLVIKDTNLKKLENTDILKTNQNIELEGADEKSNIIVVVKGDINSNGNVDLRDIVKLNNYRIDGGNIWTNAEKIAYKSLKNTEITETQIEEITFRDIVLLNNYRIR